MLNDVSQVLFELVEGDILTGRSGQASVVGAEEDGHYPDMGSVG